MNKLRSSFLCICLILLATPAFANEIIFMNANKFPINALRLTNQTTGKGYSLLTSPLAPQESLRVQLEDDGLWGIMAVDPNGSAVYFEDIDMQHIKQIHIFANGTMDIYR